jgi:hydroxymethylbilane synthase
VTDNPVLRIATRTSPLALWQATHVAGLLATAWPGLDVEVVPVDTEGDRRLDVPISSFGGKGVFAKEVQAAVLDGRADLAVHSAKDLPAVTIDGLRLAAVPGRGDARDALVGAALTDLAPGATVATGSQRRRAQLSALRPDLEFVELRGNMATRLSRVPAGGAVVVAAVALERLGLADRVDHVFAVDQMVPQVAQGALAIECRADDVAVNAMVRVIEHAGSRRRVDAERAFLVELGGDCDLPAGAHAVLDGSGDDAPITLTGVLAASGEPGSRVERHTATGTDPVSLGRQVARHLRSAIS